jgi:Ca2+-binding EF-hand superfamily protein
MTMKEELMQAFKVFDTDNLGAIPVSEMRYYLRKYGITMPEDEVEDLLKDSEPEDGYVRY